MVAARYWPDSARLGLADLRSRLADYCLKAQLPPNHTFNERILIEHCDSPEHS